MFDNYTRAVARVGLDIDIIRNKNTLVIIFSSSSANNYHENYYIFTPVVNVLFIFLKC